MWEMDRGEEVHELILLGGAPNTAGKKKRGYVRIGR